ncbi:MAG: 4-hydroxythreonine-4-phosphate dehydrogenase PdxA [Flavobacteriales bacterium AspAUS03]
MNCRIRNPRVGISVGDINGIGIEVFLKVCRKKGFLDFFTPVLFGSTRLCSYYKQMMHIDINLQGIRNPMESVDHKVNVVNLWKEDVKIDPGRATYEGRRCALLSLEAAVKSLKEGVVDVLVTAPVNKDLIRSTEFPFIGHTDYLQSSLEGESLMFMIHDDLKVALVTDHLPLKGVSLELSTEKIVKKIKLLHQSLRQDFAVEKPKIAVLGCNPHSGDNGLVGDEEQKKIRPAIENLFRNGFLVFGPYPADGFFGNRSYQAFDAVLAMYHDQGLIPFKTIAFHEGINFTAGLSHVRTSPDHGVAYDIVGKGIADETSFQEAIFSAIKIYHNRSEFATLQSNPLRKWAEKIIPDMEEDLPDDENFTIHL